MAPYNSSVLYDRRYWKSFLSHFLLGEGVENRNKINRMEFLPQLNVFFDGEAKRSNENISFALGVSEHLEANKK